MPYKDRETRLAAMRAWGRANPRTETKREWRHANPDKIRERKRRAAFIGSVHQRVKRAIARGELIPEPCLFCDATEDVVAHHHDYRKPFAVTWLCRLHHALVHRGIEEII